MSELSKEFSRVMSFDFDVVSTVDHPFVSPPIRLVSSHTMLQQMSRKKKICILNWDVSQPNNRTYRYDNQIDLLIVGKNRQLLMFDESLPYVLQKSNVVDLALYSKIFFQSLDKMQADRRISSLEAERLTRNFNFLYSNVIDVMMGGDGRLIKNYTQNFLHNFYNMIQLEELAEFVNYNYQYYFNSELMTKWIPFCLRNSPSKKSITRLMEEGVILRRPFRAVDKAGIDVDNIRNESILEIARFIEESRIIPSIDIFYWSMELAGKKHFGNDYNFFERYSDLLHKKISTQITNRNDNPDSFNLYQVEEDYGMIHNNNKLSYPRVGAKSKLTRINSMNSVYILKGEKLTEINPLSRESTSLSLSVTV